MTVRACAIALAAAITFAYGCTTTTTTGVTDPSLVKSRTETTGAARAKTRTELGAGYYARGQYEIALEELNTALRDDPGYAPAHGMLGLVYSELHDDPQAERHFLRATELSPQDPEVRNNYGWFLCQRGRETQAIGQFELAVRNPFYRTPDMALVNAGRCALRIGDRKNAEAYLQRALAISPSNSSANFVLAELAYKAGDLDLARTRMRIVMQSTSTPEGLMLGACIERKLGNRGEESSYVSQLRQRFPNAREAREIDSGGCL